MKLVLIGGYPKGSPFAFSLSTVSGRRLHALIEKVGLKRCILLDLWETEAQEKDRIVSDQMKTTLYNYLSAGYVLVALGNYQRDALYPTLFPFVTLPHPASRSPKDLAELERGLRILEALKW